MFRLYSEHNEMNKIDAHAYSAYGYAATFHSTHQLLGFNGEHAQAPTSLYILGSGYRAYNTDLMRFISPDSLSPFGDGGFNTYAYCSGDPINYLDPSGQASVAQLLKVRSQRPLLKSAAARERHPLGLLKPQAAPGPTESVPEGFNLVGYHGSSVKHKKSLEAGIRLQGNDDNTMGDGFYFSSNREVASMYAGNDGGKGIVYGVYSKNFKTLKKGSDFDYFGGSKELFFIREQAFDNFVVRERIEGALIRRNSYSNKRANRRR